MATLDKELAFFGGWTRRVVAGGDHQWGSPTMRVMEFAPSAISNLFLPPDSSWLCRGVPYWVVNSGGANLVVKRPSDNATVLTVTAGTAAMFIPGDSWYGTSVSAAVQFGGVYPALRYDITLGSSVPNVNILNLAIQRGYTGAQPAAVTFRIRSGQIVGTRAQALRSVTTGNTFLGISWAAGSYVRLVVESGGLTGGWGGSGGHGGLAGTGAAAGFPGEPGGQAIRAEIPLRIDCQGLIFGGGGGGGGGSSSLTNVNIIGGGGGGGRGVNMNSAAVVIPCWGGATAAPAQPGGAGGPYSRGLGGAGASTGGNGGTGGSMAAPGFSGYLVGGAPGAAGGLEGAAISYLPAAGAPIILAGAGNIIGAIVAEAS